MMAPAHSNEASGNSCTTTDDAQSPMCELLLVFFSTGTPEVWLQFLESVEKTFQGHNLMTGSDRHHLLWRGDALAAFEAAAANRGNATIEHSSHVT
jgi:hypothetical protein